MGAIFKREFKSYFISPIGYVCLAVFAAFEGSFFATMYENGYPDVTYVFSGMFVIALFVIPILTMRLFSEDRRQKVDQAIFTAPIGLWSVSFGKFFAALSVFMIGYLPTLIYQLILSAIAKPDWQIYFGNLLGILLLGAAMIALGMFISSLTESQVVSAVGSFAVSFGMISLGSLADSSTNNILTKIVSWISFSERYSSFVSGTFDLANFLFFVSFVAVFIFLTVRVLEKKRYA